jgi:hypothetical protein
MYGPVSRVPESVSVGDHTIGGVGGAGDPESGLIYIYVYYIYPLAVKRGNEKSSINGVLMGTSSING